MPKTKGQWITSLNGTYVDLSNLGNEGVLLTSIPTIGCSNGMSVAGPESSGSTGELPWGFAAAAGYSGIAVFRFPCAFFNFTLYAANGISQAFGFGPTSELTENYNFRCPVGMRLAGIHGQRGLLLGNIASMGAVCRTGGIAVKALCCAMLWVWNLTAA
jgi:hypothetical protein